MACATETAGVDGVTAMAVAIWELDGPPLVTMVNAGC
jgi:hypothetical protein